MKPGTTKKRNRSSTPGFSSSAMPSSYRLLIQPKHIPARIAEPRRYFWRVHADRLHDLAAVCEDRFDRDVHVIGHDVDEDAGSRRRWAANNPCSADLARCVIEGEMAVATFARRPAEDLRIEIGGALDVGGRNFDVADLSVGVGRRHERLLFQGV